MEVEGNVTCPATIAVSPSVTSSSLVDRPPHDQLPVFIILADRQHSPLLLNDWDVMKSYNVEHEVLGHQSTLRSTMTLAILRRAPTR